MRKNKYLVYLFLPIIWTGLLSGQSLVELAKKEKSRREKSKGKKTLVVTNADLNKKRTNLIKTAAPPQKTNQKESTQKPVSEKIPVELSRDSTLKKPPEDRASKKAELQEKWEKAKQQVDQLSQKMNILWQAYYTLADTSRIHLLQQQISLTHLDLLKARQNADKLKAQLDHLK